MDPTDGPHWIWEGVRRHDARILPRIVATLASAVFFIGLAMIGAWVIAVPFGTGATINNWYRVRDEHLGIAFGLAALAWFGLQVAIWWRLERGRHFARAFIQTIGVWIVAIICMFAAGMSIRREEEYIIAGLALLAAAGTLTIWGSALIYRPRGRTVITSEDLLPDLRLFADRPARAALPGVRHHLHD